MGSYLSTESKTEELTQSVATVATNATNFTTVVSEPIYIKTETKSEMKECTRKLSPEAKNKLHMCLLRNEIENSRNRKNIDSSSAKIEELLLENKILKNSVEKFKKLYFEAEQTIANLEKSM